VAKGFGFIAPTTKALTCSHTFQQSHPAVTALYLAASSDEGPDLAVVLPPIQGTIWSSAAGGEGKLWQGPGGMIAGSCPPWAAPSVAKVHREASSQGSR
jgi:hypothetical protein